MAAYQTIFEILLYVSEGLIIFYYAHRMFEQKYSNIKSMAFIALGYTILFLVYKFDIALLNICFIALINTLIFILLYNCNFKTAFFHSIMLICIMGACEWILIFIISTILHEDFNAYQNDFTIHVFNIITSKTIYYLICVAITNFFSKDKKQGKNTSVFWGLMVMPFTSLLILLALRYITYEVVLSSYMQIFLSAVSALLLITNIVVFFLYEYAIQDREKLYELETTEQRQKTDETYMAVLEQTNMDLKIFTHDIKNHLEQISHLNNNEAIQGYISELYGTIQKYETVGASHNKTLDIIISKYNTLCESKSIEISFNVKTANLSFMSDVDLSTVFNNAMDNAVEAAQQSKRKKITVDIFSKGAYEVVKIKNGCDHSPNVQNEKLLTKKKDKKHHGLGIKSVQRVLKKYNGIYDWEYDDNQKIFITTIAIPKK